MIPKDRFAAEMKSPRVVALFARADEEPHVRSLVISRKTAVNLHLSGISVEHAHGILDHLAAVRSEEADRRRAEREAPNWEIRTSPDMVVPMLPEGKPEPALRVSYRPEGSRGRFHTFLIVGPLPEAPMSEIVTRYNARSGPAAWRKGGQRR